jgi:succinate dehydrogenase flavin-adding protein (antitoxin of CptAB toxin-antitoxin module)
MLDMCSLKFNLKAIYNYADDNTLSYSDADINNLVKTLEMESLELIKWFSINQMTKCRKKNMEM